MFAHYLWLLLLGITIECITANNYKLGGQIAGLPEDVSPSLARIFMDGGNQIAIPKDTGKFYFSNLPVGEHSLEIHLNGYEWFTYLIDVRNDGKIRSYIQNNKKEPLPPQLIIMPVRQAKYVADPKPWNPLSFFKTMPGMMILLMVVTTVILPKMMEGMDPQQMVADAQAEGTEQQQQQSVQSSGGSSSSSNSHKRNRRK
eukprot:355859_1